MKKNLTFLWIFSFFFFLSSLDLNAQSKEDAVFTLPFHMDARLLVFKGKMNGHEIDFAFDTGAAQGLAGKHIQEKGGLSKRMKSMVLTDANQAKKKVRRARTNLIEIGGFKISNVSSLLFDMPYLVCHDYYLLGSNVIEKLNWKIDFDKKLIHVSLKPFPIESHFAKIPVKYRNTRPYVAFNFAGHFYDNILIDTGFSGILDLSDRDSNIQDFLASKKSMNLHNPSIGLNTGAISQNIAPNHTILLDSLTIADVVFPWVPINFESPTTNKIGLRFFSHFSKETIINNSESAYYLNLKENPGRFKAPNFLSFNYQDKKVVIAGKSVGLTPEDELIEIGEEVLEVNGIPTSSFEDQCQFIQWYYGLNFDQVSIKKTNGEEVVFSRIPLKK
jgi:predicted aspartyl protease